MTGNVKENEMPEQQQQQQQQGSQSSGDNTLPEREHLSTVVPPAPQAPKSPKPDEKIPDVNQDNQGKT